MPRVTPSRHGSPRHTPAFAPAAVSITLLGPGVTAATTPKIRNATACSVVMSHLRAT
jgi:malonyl CoA-acyl carrier protein transacylase